MKDLIVMGFIVLSMIAAGCSHSQKVRAGEGGSDVPYYSLGTLEVQKKADLFLLSNAGWGIVEAMTLTLADAPSRADRYKKALRDKLAGIAKRNYGADQVINVTYWPDPDLGKFPRGGTIFARGEMIRYQEFPSKAAKT